MKNQSLIEIVSNAAVIEMMLVENGGEITEEIESMLAIKDIQLPAKIDTYAAILDRMKMIQEYYEEKAKQLESFAKAAKKVQERCKDNLVYAMHLQNITSLDGFDTKFKLMKAAPGCDIVDEKLVPDEFKELVTTTKIDKKAIIAKVNSGEFVPGVRVEQSEYVRQFSNRPK